MLSLFEISIFMIKAVIFDIDGTLLDTTEFIYKAFEHTLKQFGLSSISRNEIKPLMGQTLNDCYISLAPQIDTSILVESHRKFQENNLSLVIPYRHTAAVLSLLKSKGLKLIAITTRSKRTSLSTLKLTEILDYFDLVLSEEDTLKPKPDPEGIEKVLKIFQIKKVDAIFVGDTESDMLAGKNAGVKTIGATYGFHGKSIEDHNPDFLVDDIKEILPIVTRQ